MLPNISVQNTVLT